MTDLSTQAIIVTIMGGWCVVFAFGSKIQEWYEYRKSIKQQNLREVKK